MIPQDLIARLRSAQKQSDVFMDDLDEAADMIESLQRQRDDLAASGQRLALELECLLMDTRDTAIQSKWWDSAHEALNQWRDRKYHV